MKLVQGSKVVSVNTESNWPLIEDLFIKWGHEVKQQDEQVIVKDISKITSELSAWGIPWKRLEWEY